jgi:hypothetical protein
MAVRPCVSGTLRFWIKLRLMKERNTVVDIYTVGSRDVSISGSESLNVMAKNTLF